MTMTTMQPPSDQTPTRDGAAEGQLVIGNQVIKDNLPRRNRIAQGWAWLFFSANLVGVLALIVLLLTIINQNFGLIAVKYAVQPSEISTQPLDSLDTTGLTNVLAQHLPKARLRVLFRDKLVSEALKQQVSKLPISQLLEGKSYDPLFKDKKLVDLSEADLAKLLMANLSVDDGLQIIETEILKKQIIHAYPLFEAWLNRGQIQQEVSQDPDMRLENYSWVNLRFLRTPIASTPSETGLRTAIFGSLWIIFITIVVSIPLGLGAAIYLEEYATPSRLNRLIETNIRNLAGVPSIIYGMLGLSVFVFFLERFTSGAIFGVTDSSGRTILSAGLTMSLLILPVVIINAQEAIRAVPRSLREASYGVGATKWQTTWRTVLPAAIPGILTGLILAFSRAVGETAPLLVIGASTFINVDPQGPFSKFTVIPIQIYQWVAKPQPEFKYVAAGAIVVLLVLLLSLNASAIILRQRISRSLQL